jgi:SAM-dependent methyltransferase
MTPWLLDVLCDPHDKSPLRLVEPVFDRNSGQIESGRLLSASGRSYPIVKGVPRFVEATAETSAVASFGDEWNYFNFMDFKSSWLTHTVHNTFGSPQAFRGKVIVDAGAGSGAQTRWMREYGARHVIALELSHSVDGVMRDNLIGMTGIDVVQCSIDAPPLRDGAIDGMVICHNVIQHTPSVEHTARALWKLLAPGGEFVFNCYPKNDHGLLRKWRLVLYAALRRWLSARSFRWRLNYARAMAMLRFLPGLGWFLEKSLLMVRGTVPNGPNYLLRCYKAGVLNTFDYYGAHAYQHLKSDQEIRELVAELQPDASRVRNLDRYFLRPPPIGIGLRLQK